MISICRSCIFSILFVSVFLSYVRAEDSIIVHDAWMLEAPPNARVIAGYMTIENRSSRSRKLIGVSSEKFKRIEIHRTEMQGDIMKMVLQEELAIPAEGAVSLQPGSYHLMLIGPESVPKEGDVIQITLQFEDGYTKQVNAAVRPLNIDR